MQAVVFRLGVRFDAFLDGVPGGQVNDGLAIFFNDLFAIFEDADEEAVGEEGVIGGDAGEDLGLGVDLAQRGARGFEGKCQAHPLYEIRVREPAMGNSDGAIFIRPDLNWFSFEAIGRGAGHTSKFEHEVFESTFGIAGGLTAFFFVGEVDKEFDDASVFAFGDLVGDGVDGDAPLFADDNFVELGIVYIACEAGVIPQDESGGTLGGVIVGIEHAVEIVTPNEGATRAGFIDKAITMGELVLLAIGFDLAELLVGGFVLARSATVTAIGVDDGAGGEGGWGREEVHSLVAVGG